jgi:hypothetical protein
MAAMRSVSFTRQLAMPVRRVVPSAYSAITASVIAASGMWLQSSVIACSGQRPRRTSIQPGPLTAPGAHGLGGLDEADVALDRVAAHAFDAHRRVAVAAMAPSATKYDADEASPSTWISPGVR